MGKAILAFVMMLLLVDIHFLVTKSKEKDEKLLLKHLVVSIPRELFIISVGWLSVDVYEGIENTGVNTIFLIVTLLFYSISCEIVRTIQDNYDAKWGSDEIIQTIVMYLVSCVVYMVIVIGGAV